MRFLRTNTAVIVTVGPFYDATNGVTIETALTITNEKITLTADTDDGSAPTNILDNVTGATSGTDNDLNYITNNDAGMMQLELSAANTNRLGRMLLSITDAANHVPVFHEFMVLPAAVYDSLVLGTDKLAVDAQEISSDATAADNAELFFDGTGYAAANSTVGTVTTLTNANPTAAAVADAVWDEASTGHTDAGKAGEQLWTDIDAILTDTGTTLDGRIPAALVSGRMDASVGAMAANVVTASALAADAVDEIIDETIGDGTVTVRQALKLLAAYFGGKTSGGGTTTITYRNVADTVDVAVIVADVNGNRSAVTLTL